MPEDRQAILAVILAVKRGFVSPEEGMKILEQAEAQLAAEEVSQAEATVYQHVPEDRREELRREATILAADTTEAARVLEEAGVPQEVQQTLLDLGTRDPEQVEATLLSLSPKRATTIIERPQAKPPTERYKLLREHARGGMGRILVALDTTVGREVALKELLPGRGGSTTGKSNKSGAPTDPSMAAVARFMREATVTAQLEHPNIVPVYEIGTRDDGSLYYTMKFVRGRTLATRLRSIRNDPDLTPSQKLAERMKLLDAFVDVCNAIAFSHSRGVIHRDIKPANIMLGDYGEALVLDWGLAGVREKEEISFANGTPVSDSHTADLTLEGEVMGTPAYMAPEQAAGKLNEVDERSDIYSLGAVLYEIVTGEAPYKGKSAKDVLSSVLSERPRDINIVTPEAPPELAALVMRALARDPSERYQNAMELAEQVQAYRDGRMVSVYRYSATELLKRFVSRHRAAVTVFVLALLVLIAGGAYGYQRVVSERDAALAAESDAQQQRHIAQMQAAEAERQKQIAQDEAAEADRQKGIAADKAREAEAERAAAELAAKKAAAEEDRANREAEAARASEAVAREQSELARKALQQAQRNLAEAHMGYAALARERNESGTELVHLAAAHKADKEIVSRARLLGEVHSRSFPLWRTRSYTDLPAGPAAFSQDRRFCAAPLHKPPRSIYEFNATTTVLSDVGIWDVATGTLLRRIETVADTRSLLFNPDGSRIVSIESGGSIRIWDVATGAEILNRPGHAWGTSPRIVSAGEKSFFTAVSDGRICEWMFADGSPGRVFTLEDRAVQCLAVSPDGNYLAAGDDQNNVTLWDLSKPDTPLTRAGDTLIAGLAFVGEGLLVLRSWQESELLDLTMTEVQKTFNDLALWSLNGAEVSADRTSILISQGENGWKLLDLHTGDTLAVRGRSNGHVLAAALSPDGSTVVAALKGEGFDIVSRTGASLVERAPDHILGSLALAVSPDGQYYASGDFGGRLMLRRVLDGSTVWHNKISSNNIQSVAYSPNGSLIAVFSVDGVLSFVNASTGATTRFIKENLFGFGLKFSPDGEQVCVPTREGEALVINARTAEIEKRMRLPGGSNVLTLECDPREDRIWLLDNFLAQWSWRWREDSPPVKDGAISAGNLRIYTMTASPDGRLLMVATESGNIVAWETDPVRLRFNQKVSPGPITNCAFGTTSEYFVCGGGDGLLCYVDARTGSVVERVRANPGAVAGVAVTPDGRNVITSGADGEFQAWYSPAFMRPELAQIGISAGSNLALSPDAQLAAMATDQGIIRIFHADTLKPAGEFYCSPFYVFDLEFSRDGRYLAAAHTGGRVVLWSVAEASVAREVAVYDEPQSIGFDADNRLVVCGANYGVQVRDADTGELVAAYREQRGYQSLRVLPDGKRVLLSGYDVTPRLVDIASGEVSAELESMNFRSQAVAVSSDSRMLGLMRDRGQIGVYDSSTGKLLRSLKIRGGTVRSMDFLPGDARLLCTFDNRSGVLIDALTGDELDVTHLAVSYVSSAVLALDGAFALIGGSGGDVQRWSLRWNLNRLQSLAQLDIETVLAMTQVLSGLKLDNLKAIPIPRETGAVTWLTPDGKAPHFLRGGAPDWIPRFIGARVSAAREFLGRNSDRRAERIDEVARDWVNQFEGYRYKEVLASDLSVERVDIPPRERDASGNYIGNPEGMIDLQAWLRDQRQSRRAAAQQSVTGLRNKADTALESGRLRLAQQLYRQILRENPIDVEAALKLTEVSIKLDDVWGLYDVFDRLIESASVAEHARLYIAWGEWLALTGDPNAALEKFRLARQAGYTAADWHLIRVRALERSGAYAEGLVEVQAALLEVEDPALRAALAQVGARCQVWARLQSSLENLPALVVTSAEEGSGFARHDVLLRFRVEGSEVQFGADVQYQYDLTYEWDRFLHTAEQGLEAAIFTVLRNGEEIEVTVPRDQLPFTFFSIQATG